MWSLSEYSYRNLVRVEQDLRRRVIVLEGDPFLEHPLLVQLDNFDKVGVFGQEGCNSHSEGMVWIVGEGHCEYIPGSLIWDHLIFGASFLLHGCLCYTHAGLI